MTDEPSSIAFRSCFPCGDWMGVQGAMTMTYDVERVSPTHPEATTSVSTTDGGPFPVTGSVSIALDCPTCSTGP